MPQKIGCKRKVTRRRGWYCEGNGREREKGTGKIEGGWRRLPNLHVLLARMLNALTRVFPMVKDERKAPWPGAILMSCRR